MILFLCVMAMAQSQVSKTIRSTTQVRSATQSQPQSQTNQGSKSQVPQENQVTRMKFIPAPKKVHFIRYTKVFNSPVRSSTTMDYQQSMQTNRQASTTIRNQSDSKNMANRQVSSAGSSYVRSTTALASEYYVKTRMIAGHKVNYYLTSQINGWPQDQALIKPNIIRKQPLPDPDNAWHCSSVTVAVEAQSTTFMNALPERQASALLPGMIYSFDDFFSGNFNQKYNFNRNPITLVSDVLNSRAPVSANVDDPNLGSISNGVSSIVNQYTPLQAHGDYKIQTLLTDNQSDQDIIVTTGGAYGGFSGTNSFHHTENDHHFYFTINAVKELYTVSVQPGQNGYYQGGNVPSSNSPLIMIQNVTYGARVLANMDVEISSTSNVDGLHLKYDDMVDNANIDLNTLFSNNSIRVSINGYLIGFPAKFPASFSATKDNFLSMLNQFFSGCDYQSAAPIEYGFVNMSGDEMGLASATDAFTVPECVPAKDIYTLKSVFFTLKTGADGKNDDSQFTLTIGINDGSNNALISPMIGQFKDDQTEYKSGSTLYSTPIPPTNNSNYPNGYTLDDFANGGYVTFYLHCADKLFQSDDWDIVGGRITFNFVSQKGVPYSPDNSSFDIPTFRLSSTTNGFKDGNQTFWFNSGFKPQQSN